MHKFFTSYLTVFRQWLWKVIVIFSLSGFLSSAFKSSDELIDIYSRYPLPYTLAGSLIALPMAYLFWCVYLTSLSLIVYFVYDSFTQQGEPNENKNQL